MATIETGPRDAVSRRVRRLRVPLAMTDFTTLARTIVLAGWVYLALPAAFAERPPAPEAAPAAAADSSQGGFTTVVGRVLDADGAAVDTAGVELLSADGTVLARCDVGDDGHFYVQHGSTHSAAVLQPAEVQVIAVGHVTRRVDLSTGRSDLSDDDRYVRMDVVLASGRAFDVVVVDWERSPLSGARVEVRRRFDRPSMWEPPPLGAVTTDGSGAGRMEDLPASGLAEATVHLPGLEDWFRTTVDLAEPRVTLAVPRPSSLRVELPVSAIQEKRPLFLLALSERYPKTAYAEVDAEGVATLSPLREGDVVGLGLLSSDGRVSWLAGRTAVPAASIPALLRVDSIAGPSHWTGPRARPNEPENRVRFDLVDADGAPLALFRAGSLAPWGLTASWRKGGRSGASKVLFQNQWSSESALEGEFAVPAEPPFDVTLRWQRIEIATATIKGTRDRWKVAWDPTTRLRPLRSVRFLDVGLPEPHGGWTVELRRCGRRERFFAHPDHRFDGVPIVGELPPGRYEYAVDSPRAGKACGTLEVTADGPDAMDVEFHGLGAATVRFEAEAPVISLALLRRGGAALPGVGAHFAVEGPPGTFAFDRVLAGEYDLVAKLLLPDGALAVRVAEGRRVDPDSMADLGEIEWRGTSTAGPRLRRSPSAHGVEAIVRTGDRCLFAGAFAPGDALQVPAGREIRIQVEPTRAGGANGYELVLPVSAGPSIVEF